jgi:hypothetical protein
MTNDLDASIFDEFSGLGAGNTRNTGGLTLPALQRSGAGSFAPGNPLGFGASSATDASSTFTGSPADLTGIPSAGNATNTDGLTLPALQGSGAGSFAPDNPLGFGASSATNAYRTFTGSPADLTGISSAGAVGIQGSVGTVAGAGGAPVNITNLPGADTAITGAGKAAQSGAGTVGGDITSGVGSLTGTAASAISSLETYTSSAFVVIALVVLGAIFIAFVLGLFGKLR